MGSDDVVRPQVIQLVPIEKIKPYSGNAKLHPEGQINKLVKIIKDVGFKGAILVDKNMEIIAGHGRYLAAKKLGMKEIPVIVDKDLTPEQVRRFRIADNKIAESPWDMELLVEEMALIQEEWEKGAFDFEYVGFGEEEWEASLTAFHHERVKTQRRLNRRQPAWRVTASEAKEKWDVRNGMLERGRFGALAGIG
jgi:ParB-like chromosome segregation protein Spo0J